MPDGRGQLAWDAIAHASEHSSEDRHVASLRLPLSWRNGFHALEPQLIQGWDAIVLVGYTEAASLAVERLALNETDARMKDAENRRPLEHAVVAGGEPGFWTGLPYRELTLRLTQRGVPAFSSHHAGAYVPNCVFYHLMRWIQHNQLPMVGGLLQLPVGEGAKPFDADVLAKIAPTVIEVLSEQGQRPDSLHFDLDRLRLFKGSPTP